jgi:hypothetical protein
MKPCIKLSKVETFGDLLPRARNFHPGAYRDAEGRGGVGGRL